MSDISINITWWELLIVSPVLGWPGAIVGAVLGYLLWRKRPIAGAAIGALTGNLAWFTLRLMTM
ncbi:MAG: hypothetical protein KBA31_20410 [Alphaproteobacteria bacterium]|nr:hypothetical protein [Alphaproteobacteria bacterium]